MIAPNPDAREQAHEFVNKKLALMQPLLSSVARLGSDAEHFANELHDKIRHEMLQVWYEAKIAGLKEANDKAAGGC